jgi:hypothetical protein
VDITTLQPGQQVLVVVCASKDGQLVIVNINIIDNDDDNDRQWRRQSVGLPQTVRRNPHTLSISSSACLLICGTAIPGCMPISTGRNGCKDGMMIFIPVFFFLYNSGSEPMSEIHERLRSLLEQQGRPIRVIEHEPEGAQT